MTEITLGEVSSGERVKQHFKCS